MTIELSIKYASLSIALFMAPTYQIVLITSIRYVDDVLRYTCAVERYMLNCIASHY